MAIWEIAIPMLEPKLIMHLGREAMPLDLSQASPSSYVP
jgi:hypothetical protein